MGAIYAVGPITAVGIVNAVGPIGIRVRSHVDFWAESGGRRLWEKTMRSTQRMQIGESQVKRLAGSIEIFPSELRDMARVTLKHRYILRSLSVVFPSRPAREDENSISRRDAQNSSVWLQLSR